MKTAIRLLVVLLALSAVIVACSGGGGGSGGGAQSAFTVTYDGNGSTAGNVPIDPNKYAKGQTVTVLGNTGNLVQANHSFAGWNAQASGGGTAYAPAQTFVIGGANVILYAQWTASGSGGYSVTYDGNGSTGGSAPIDSNSYATGQTVTVLGNTGNLVYTGYDFVGWQTAADGSGTTYVAGQTFSMGPASITLHALWSGGYAYATNQMSQDISQYTIGPNGALTPMAVATVASGTEPMTITIDPSGKYVYVPDVTGATVSQYTIGAGGALEPMSPAAVSTGTGAQPVSVAINPSSTYAYVVNQIEGNYGNVLWYPIGATGALGTPSAPLSPGAGTDELTSVAVHPSGKNVYVTTLRNDYVVYQYTIGAGGALVAMTPASVQAGSGPRQITIHPSGNYAYVACFDYGTIYQYTIDPNSGALTPMSPISVTVGPQPFNITVHPSGKYAYVPNWNGNDVSQFNIDANSGALTAMSTATVPAGLSPLTIAVDPTGKYAYVTNSAQGNISQYSIGTDGALTAMPNMPPTGANPWAIATRGR
jgi:6-phosphogluconolactonase (cycloisomerase 2 family)